MYFKKLFLVMAAVMLLLPTPAADAGGRPCYRFDPDQLHCSDVRPFGPRDRYWEHGRRGGYYGRPYYRGGYTRGRHSYRSGGRRYHSMRQHRMYRHRHRIERWRTIIKRTRRLTWRTHGGHTTNFRSGARQLPKWLR